MRHEGFVQVSIRDSKPLENEFPADVVDMVPNIAKLKPNVRKALHRLLEQPEAMAGILTSIDRLAARTSPDEDRDSD